MRYSLVILAFLATAFGAVLGDQTTMPPTSKDIANGNDQDLVLGEELEMEAFENSETLDPEEELDIVEEEEEIFDAEEEVDFVDEEEDEILDEEAEEDAMLDEEAEEDAMLDAEAAEDEILDEEVEGNEAGADEPQPEGEIEEEEDPIVEDEIEEEIEGDEDTVVEGDTLMPGEDTAVQPSDSSGGEEDEDASGAGNQEEDEGMPGNQEDEEDIFETESETINPTFFESDKMTTSEPEPLFKPTLRPTLRPVKPYVGTDDDPLKGEDEFDNDFESNLPEWAQPAEEWVEDWFSEDSTIEEMEHNKTVVITLSVVFGVMFFFSVFVAYQMLENPDGCCASICRITVACWCGCILYPCRKMCGCTGQSTANHMMVPSDGHIAYDLELS